VTSQSPDAAKNRFGADAMPRNPANFAALSPLGWLARTARLFPHRLAVVHGDHRTTWQQTEHRCLRFAAALARRGIKAGDVVAIMAPNVPAHFEAHFAVPMLGAIINPLNTRLDAATIAFILQHGAARALLSDTEYASVVAQALALLPPGARPLVIDIADPLVPDGQRLGEVEYEAFLSQGDAGFVASPPADEWDAIMLSYTSGTTGDPKGVVTSHRGACLNSMGNVLVWSLPLHPVYLWTLPMFHASGWCFPWTITLQGGTHVCLRRVDAATMYHLIAQHGVTHMSGAPVVMGMLLNGAAQQASSHQVRMMTAGAAPPAAVIEGMERLGFDITHVYGLTEVYGPVTVCVRQAEWANLPKDQQARLLARQGVAYPVLEGLMVADPETLKPVPSDGQTIGEIMMRGNVIMKGYMHNQGATETAFAGGWFHTGDLAVCHPDGYIEIRDRSKDIVISGGENISTIEVEGVLYRHPAVLEAAVVARPDEKWGETPCAFVTLRPGMSATEAELIAFCRDHLAHFKAPRSIIFADLPKTSTGKMQKHILRARARALTT
jgi:fatty-acyl-CoA synthase